MDNIIYGLKNDTLRKIVDTIKNNGKIKKLILFGSRAKGTEKKGSDIDISYISNDLTLKELHQIKMMLDDLMLPYKIDLIDYSQIKNQDLKEHILRVGKVLK